MTTRPLTRVLEDAALGLLVGAAALATSRFPDVEDRRGVRGRGPGEGRWEPQAGPPVEVDPLPLAGLEPARLAAAAGLVLALALRRTAPRAAHVGALTAMAVFLLAGGGYGPVLLAPALTVHALVTRLPPRQLLPLLAAVPLALSAGFWTAGWSGLADPGLYLTVVLGTAAVLLPGLVALVLAGRREAQRQDALAERRRHAYEERLQIAREVHDVVGHSLAVINMQAGVALHVLEKRPDQLRPALEAIRGTSKTALAELSSTLATFRGESRAAGAPGDLDGQGTGSGLAGLDGLVGALRAAGRTVRLSRPPAEELALPVAVEHAALRIAQEGLTNVVRHGSPDAAVDVTLARTGATLVVEVVDDGLRLPTALVEGSGIAGMRERARAVGGTLVVGPRPGGRGFGVRAELPVGGAG